MIKKTISLSLISLCLLPYSIKAQTNDWGSIHYNGKPWVENVSRPFNISKGLQNRHLSLWASHGRYFDNSKAKWIWQRPNLFCTTEDLFTQTIVVPYLIPMLQNAGAVVFTPRERDWQYNEVIVDNDNPTSGYREQNDGKSWSATLQGGFAYHQGNYTEGENPFTQGTARQIKASKKKKHHSVAKYQPYIPEEGQYAVYVSYTTLKGSVDDAEYTVYHQGEATTFHVNQQMGGGTWVYLGTFTFDKGSNPYNQVIVSNYSRSKGIVTTDAVRFGGGMGNIERGGSTSGLPRCLEAARYSIQWAGAPMSVYSTFNGENDYNDDLNSRSYMLNWLAGGSSFVPNTQGKNVPIELQLAVHSDAGVKENGIVGTLGVCTTNYQDNLTYQSGLSRSCSKTFADQLVEGVARDVQAQLQTDWATRGVWDKNYSETRRPEVPSAILETLSHQNFGDMKLGLDPNFRFVLARSVYKTILRFVSSMHRTSYVVQPLAPTNFSIERKGSDKVRLSWSPTLDPNEASAAPTSYILYTATETGGFDNGQEIKGTSAEIKLLPNVAYHFRITACNIGGESFPTEVLSAYIQPHSKKTIMIVNGFHRLSGPACVDTDYKKEFDLNQDPGITYGKTLGWCGQQVNFNPSQAGKTGSNALGYSTSELEGKIIAGNDFNYVREHAQAIRSANKYSFVSCSSESLEHGIVDLNRYQGVDYILGLEKDDGHSLVYYTTFTPAVRVKLSNYLTHQGKLFVSGAYVASDQKDAISKQWLAETLKLSFASTNTNNHQEGITGMGTSFSIYRTLNAHHYAAYSPDAFNAEGKGFGVLQYADGSLSAVAYRGADNAVFTMAFPFECIKDTKQQALLMQGIWDFLFK